MSKMSDYDLQLQEVSAIMGAEPTESDLREMSISQLERELRECPTQDLLDIILTGVSEVCARANTCPQDVEPHEIKLGRILSRVEMTLSLLDAHKPPEKRRKPNPTYWPKSNVVSWRQ